VVDVRTHDIENVTVTVGGKTVRANVSGNPAPTEPARFTATVPVETDASRVRAAAVDPGGGLLSDRGERTVNVSAPLGLDRDLLGSRYEQRAGTDPQDPDTDDDGTLDGMENPDDDGLTNAAEQRAGTDPTSRDTDGDGIPDAVEVRVGELDATEPNEDTDVDGDGLTATEEVAAGTDVGVADTDSDGLADGRELELDTDPADADTDSDGVPDGREAELGTEPTAADSDGDGTPDSEKRNTLDRSNQLAGAEVLVNGTGGVVDDLVVTSPTDSSLRTPYVNRTSVSSIVRVEASGEVERARVRLSYDDSGVGNESDIVVYRSDANTSGLEPLNTTVDPAANTATANTTQFSSFVALAPSDDAGGGEGGTDDGAENTQFAAFLEYRHVEQEFNRSLPGLAVHREMGPNGPRVTVYVQRAATFGGQRQFTFADVEFEDARVRNLVEGPYDTHPLEGQGDGDPPVGTTEPGEVSDDEVRVLEDGTRVDLTTRNQPFKDTFALAYEVTGPNPQMTVTFRDTKNVEQVVHLGGAEPESVEPGTDIELPDLEDPDGDGIPSAIERAETLTSTGAYVETNATLADTDGDGLDDSEELTELVVETEGNMPPHFEMRSDPTDPNSDDYGLGDAREVEKGSNPMEPESFGMFFEVPTRSQSSSTPNPATGIADRRYLLEPDDVYTEGFTPDGKPDWLKAAQATTDEEFGAPGVPSTFMLVRVPVVSRSSDGERLKGVKVELTDKDDAAIRAIGTNPGYGETNWVAPGEPVTVYDNTQVVNVVLWMPKTPRHLTGTLPSKSEFLSDISSGSSTVRGSDGRVASKEDASNSNPRHRAGTRTRRPHSTRTSGNSNSPVISTTTFPTSATGTAAVSSTTRT